MKKKTLAVFFLYSLLAPGSAWAAIDPNAPELQSITIAPDPVDISAGSETVTLTLHVTDEEDGLSYGNLTIYNSENNYVRSAFFTGSARTSGTAMDGTYSVEVEIPRYAKAGTWRVDVMLRDTSAHEQNYGRFSTDPPVAADRSFEVVNTVEDAGGPGLADSIFTTRSVPPGGTVRMDAQITDDLAGFDHGVTFFYDSNGVNIEEMTFFFDDTARKLGDDLDGVYGIDIAVPENAPTGSYQLQYYLVDKVGNVSLEDGGSFTVSAGGTQPYSIGNAMDAVHLPWSSEAPAWIYQTDVSHDGTDAARSGPTPDHGESIMETYFPNAGTLTFWWRTDSEENFDRLMVDVIGTSEHRVISGNTGWLQETITIPAGGHTVRWTYQKSPSNAVGQDCGWVDEVLFLADEDAELPALQNLIISPKLADISVSSQPMSFTIVATDDNKGVMGGNLRVYDPYENEFLSFSFDESSRTAGNAQQGSYTLNATLPLGGAPGTWRVEVDLIEADTAAFSSYGPTTGAFPNPGEETFEVSDGSVGDNEAPEIVLSNLNPDSVDITAGAGSITLTVQVTDSGSGFSFGNIGVYTSGPDNWTGPTYFNASHRISGDEIDGVYQITLPVAAFGPAGTWRIGAALVDFEGNQRDYAPTSDLPGDESFEVINDGPQDTTKPIVESIDIAPVGVDVTNGPAPITITVTIKDELSGIRDAILFFHNPNGLRVDSFTQSLDAGTRISGDEFTGTYQLQVMIPLGAQTGQWEVRTFLRDRVGEALFYGTDAEAYPQVGDGKFSVSTGGGGGGSVYQSFATLYNLSGAQAFPSADPDGDGLNNATELLLGTNPTTNSGNAPGLFSVTRDATHMHLFFTVDPSLDADMNGVYLELGGGSLPFRVTGQSSSKPGGPWTDVVPVPVNGSTYRISRALSSSPDGYLRLYFQEGN